MSIQTEPFQGVDHSIPLQEAVEMTARYRQDHEKILDESMRGKKILPNSETFNREAFDSILAQAGCEGIRLYYSMDDKLKLHIIAVGVDAENNDMIVSDIHSPNFVPVIIENGVRCPQLCPPASELNS